MEHIVTAVLGAREGLKTDPAPLEVGWRLGKAFSRSRSNTESEAWRLSDVS